MAVNLKTHLLFMKQVLSLFALAAVVLGAGCRKKPLETPEPSTGTLRIAFRNVVGAQNVVLGPTMYTTASGDSFSISMLKYFISNIELLDASGNAMKPEPTYNLIDQSPDGSRVATGEGFANGTYTQIRFMIGVDSARNVSGAQTGDLDPAGTASGMFWDWNTGYIMAKLEGTSPQSSGESGSLIYHIGGIHGRSNVIRSVTLPLPSPAVIRGGKVTELHISADIREWFTSPESISFATTPTAMGGEWAVKIANNYMDMFTVTEVHNEE